MGAILDAVENTLLAQLHDGDAISIRERRIHKPN
jgi:hypothetical protein